MVNRKAVCFGEILYDVFPDRERIGGAPLNVASRLSGLGILTEMISKVGDDEKGEKLISYLESKNIKTENISKDPNFTTGVVNVKLSESGSATYEIAHPVAWDKIEISEETLKEEKGVIEDLILAAHNNAKSQLKTKTNEEISKAAGGFGIPGFKWPL